MTNREAISAEIEPYALSDDSLEKSFIDAAARFSVDADVDDDYSSAMKKTVALASMFCLNRIRMLTSENIGGLSQAFDVDELKKRIRAIANEAGVSSDLVLASESDDEVTYIRYW